VRAAELLLHERIRGASCSTRRTRSTPTRRCPTPELERPAVREYDTPDAAQPRVALLGRQPYTLMVSHCGGGYSRYEDLAVTRWRADGRAMTPASSAT
jgi:cyclic beta-1,2-glucan synthetase